MFDSFKNMFAKKQEAKLPTDETAWSEPSFIYSTGSFEKYNPDDLMTRKGALIYKRMMMDEQVKAVTRFKRDAITSRDYMFVMDDPEEKLSEEEKLRRIAISEQAINIMRGSFMDSLNGMMSSMYYGYSLTEMVFAQFEFSDLTYWGIGDLKLRPFDTFKFVVDEYGNIKELRQTIGGREVRLDINKFIHHINNPEYDDHYGQSELREAYRPWFGKDNAIKFYNIWLERHASGVKWIQPKENYTLNINSQEYRDLQTVMQNNRLGNTMILPSKVEMQMQFPSNNVAFKEAIDLFDLQIARSLLIPNLLGITPSGQTGSYSQSDTQLEAFFWTLDADASRLEESINEQLFRRLGDVNFGDGNYPRFKFKPVSEKKKLELIRLWKELIASNAVTKSESDEEHIRDLLNMPPKAEEEVDDDDDILDDSADIPPGDSSEGKDDSEVQDKEEKEKNLPDETVMGKTRASISAFAKTQAMQRVDFAVIARNSEAIIDEYTVRTAETMDIIAQDLIAKAKEGGSLEENISENVNNIKTDSKLKQKLNRTITASLKESYTLGQRHAEVEVDKAMRQAFSRKVNRERLNFIAEDFFKVTALKAAGGLSDEAEKIVSQEILNGAKYSKTWAEIEKSIYRTFATRGMITMEQARDALGEALNVDNPDARLRTLVRTNTYSAINDARYSYFTDPELGGYVAAFEYSSILDSRTTQICRHLDEENAGNHSVEWYNAHPEYRPPNHYNCRSLLIPVTRDDLGSYEEGPEPTIEPQGGFK